MADIFKKVKGHLCASEQRHGRHGTVPRSTLTGINIAADGFESSTLTLASLGA